MPVCWGYQVIEYWFFIKFKWINNIWVGMSEFMDRFKLKEFMNEF